MARITIKEQEKGRRRRDDDEKMITFSRSPPALPGQVPAAPRRPGPASSSSRVHPLAQESGLT
eukprot:297072-Pyramimonas_sp.AAC.1